MADIPLHHIVYGTCKDFVTGEIIVDTDDERYRQKLARYLVEEKGYEKKDIKIGEKIETLYNGQFVSSKMSMVLSSNGKRIVIIRYAPGSLVTRERSAIAAARVLDENYQIPLAVVTNGEDAELLDTYTGEILRRGLDGIPAYGEALALADKLGFAPFPDEKKRERELRILNAYDIEVCCAGGPCALPEASEGRGKE
ncbi:MAG: type I restriction enzyme HsdR N-terminal domain-containing protein [Desulfobulbaceae bacterium]|uniref:Type I restriction enzyme HsdR N-terminal domain-containing protein n=1 Tax=Candidatus Desulfobia pelagia TaxID=2841692 RepID=A0A8J6NBB4_9BACT|nr:type I restriction enzyme HsdR N-terminal domain-containing protein [Candidatus Desulfobia pelagia]